MNRIASTLISLDKFLGKIYLAIAAVCGLVWVLYMLLTVGDVTGRWVFSSPIPGTVEIGQVVLAFAVFMSLAAILYRNQHIRIYILWDRLSPRGKFWMDILCYVCGFAVIVPIAYYGLSFATESIRIREFGITYGIPLWPGKLALFVGSSLLSLEFLMQLLIRIFSRTATPIVTPVAIEEQLDA